MVEGLLDICGAVGLADDFDGVLGLGVKGLLELDGEFAGRGRGHGARHFDVCVGGWRLVDRTWNVCEEFN